jgi:anti-sigma regulatory factor (Ser/Thr protein kinase)
LAVEAAGERKRRWLIGAGDWPAATRARRDCVAFLRRAAAPGTDIAAAELIFGELVGNGVRHARTRVIVEVCAGEAPRLCVRNDGTAGPFAPCAARDDAEHGRGLFIVSRIASELHIDRDAGDIVITALIPVYRGPSSGITKPIASPTGE